MPCIILQFRHFGVSFLLASSDLKIQKESLMYPDASFISELGGSLGLFVGFSFLAVWDWFYPMYVKTKKMIKNYF